MFMADPGKRALSLYGKMLSEYGPQGWWPAKSRYEVVVGALLTQNTNWTNVEKAIANLREKRVLSPEKILLIKTEKLERLIRPSGFYRQKAERLKLLTGRYAEIIGPGGGGVPTREELLSIKGVGKETADSILLYAFGLPNFVIDAYTRRFCDRHGLCHFDEYDDYKDYFQSNLPESVPVYKEYHALIVEWGKRDRVKRKMTKRTGK
jgi:endonuclease-3 related protein